MKKSILLLMACNALVLSACGQRDDSAPDESAAVTEAPEPMAAATTATEIVPGLTMRILDEGNGDVAQAGQMATVHYTGWLYDPQAADGRGSKFDSSVDRGAPFPFELGAGRVIQGWDQGVVGMKVGEKRELVIAPEMAYGDRAVGDLIPPGSTLLFEVELLGLSGGGSATQ